MKTQPLAHPRPTCGILVAACFSAPTKRKKDGKEHRYWSVVENVRHASGPVHQRTLLYLGELNDSQQSVWIKALEIFNTDSGQTETRSLFPADRTPPPTGTPTLSLRLDDYQLSHPRQYGACWLACELWRQLGLDQFWAEKLPALARRHRLGAAAPGFDHLPATSPPAANGGCHRQWYDQKRDGRSARRRFSVGRQGPALLRARSVCSNIEAALFTHLQARWQ